MSKYEKTEISMETKQQIVELPKGKVFTYQDC
jgi:hypothetical protein